MPGKPGTTNAIKLARLALREKGHDLDSWLIGRRKAHRTWRQIETELTALTGGEGRVSYETLRLHYLALEDAAGTPAPQPEAKAS